MPAPKPFTLKKQPKPDHGLFKDIEGQRFGRWKVVGYAGLEGKYRHRWFVKCDCGTVREVVGWPLRSGKSTSCGCLQKDGIGTKSTHGDTKGRKRSPEWRAWHGMKGRCLNPKNKRYDRYGGRGIEICNEWVNSYETFLKDMGRKPEGVRWSLHRKENDKGYYKDNCIWADDDIQANERCSNVKVSYEGRTLNASQWADSHGLKRGTVLRRLRENWDPVKAITIPALPFGSDAKQFKRQTDLQF